MCSSDQVQKYRGKISGSLLDRIDLHVEVARPGRLHFRKQAKKPENSAAVRERVVAARKRQLQRAGVANAQLDNAGVRQRCKADGKNYTFLENRDRIGMRHLAEALAYRGFDCGNNQG